MCTLAEMFTQAILWINEFRLTKCLCLQLFEQEWSDEMRSIEAYYFTLRNWSEQKWMSTTEWYTINAATTTPSAPSRHFYQSKFSQCVRACTHIRAVRLLFMYDSGVNWKHWWGNLQRFVQTYWPERPKIVVLTRIGHPHRHILFDAAVLYYIIECCVIKYNNRLISYITFPFLLNNCDEAK